MAICAAAAGILVFLGKRARRIERGRQDELDRAEARYRALIDSLPLVTWLTEPDDRSSTLYVSPLIDELTGYSPSEWAEEPDLFTKLLHPDDRAGVLDELERGKNGTPAASRIPADRARRPRRLGPRGQRRPRVTRAGSRSTRRPSFANIGERKRAEDERESLLAAERIAASDTRRAAVAARPPPPRRQRALVHARPPGCPAEGRRAGRRDFADWCIVDVDRRRKRAQARRGRACRAPTRPDGAAAPPTQPESRSAQSSRAGRTKSCRRSARARAARARIASSTASTRSRSSASRCARASSRSVR